MPKGEATNPYGRTKSIIEDILADVQRAIPDMNVVLLRYFNPIGAHPSGTMGEDPAGIPNNLMPYITQVAVGKLEKLGVFGDDYDTPDGTGVRDYIHVMDLASGHVAALKAIKPRAVCMSTIWGQAMARVCSSLCTPSKMPPASRFPTPSNRAEPGDIAACYADCAKAADELGWRARYGIADMCADSWRWQQANPNGYRA